MEYIVIYYIGYNSFVEYFDNKREALVLFKEILEWCSNVHLYACKEIR